MLKDVSTEKAVKFLHELNEKYLRNGFLSLSKKDQDLLLFYLLQKYGVIDHTASIYETALALKITPQKVKTLRLESYIRWGMQDRERVIRQVLSKMFSLENVQYLQTYQAELIKKGKIPLLIEDPVEKFELENQIKKHSGIIKYERGNETIIVDYAIIVDIADNILEDKEKRIEQLRKLIQSEKKIKELFTKIDIKNISKNEYRYILNEMGYRFIASLSDSLVSNVGTLLFGRVV